MKSYVLSSCFEIDTEELYEDKFFATEFNNIKSLRLPEEEDITSDQLGKLHSYYNFMGK